MAFVAEFLANRYILLRAGILTSRGARALTRGENSEAIAKFEEALEAKR